MSQIKTAQPFVKWVGGKRSLLPSILPLIPDHIGTYFEPFAGGGAVYFALADRVSKAVLVDRNHELVAAYRSVKSTPGALITRLHRHTSAHGTDHYYRVRKQTPTTAIEIAARFLYLNRTCFNGLYRVNSAGGFNAPMGRYVNPNIVQADNIKACHRTLQNASIRLGDFSSIEAEVRGGDFVYLDPPYHPIGEVSFTRYTKENFNEFDQVRLRDFVLRLSMKGALVMLSNSNTALIRDLYSSAGFHHHLVMAPRTVNCKPMERNRVEELLITNYPTDYGPHHSGARAAATATRARPTRKLHRIVA